MVRGSCSPEHLALTYETRPGNGSLLAAELLRDAELSVTEAPRWWVEGLRAALDAAGQPGALLAAAFAAQVPGGYVERTEPAAAAADLLELAALGPETGDARLRMADLRMAVQPDPDPGAGMFRFRLYGRAAVELSTFVPILESFGLTVVEAVPHHIEAPDGGHFLHLDDFGLRARGRWRLRPRRRRSPPGGRRPGGVAR